MEVQQPKHQTAKGEANQNQKQTFNRRAKISFRPISYPNDGIDGQKTVTKISISFLRKDELECMIGLKIRLPFFLIAVEYLTLNPLSSEFDHWLLIFPC